MADKKVAFSRMIRCWGGHTRGIQPLPRHLTYNPANLVNPVAPTFFSFYGKDLRVDDDVWIWTGSGPMQSRHYSPF